MSCVQAGRAPHALIGCKVRFKLNALMFEDGQPHDENGVVDSEMEGHPGYFRLLFAEQYEHEELFVSESEVVKACADYQEEELVRIAAAAALAEVLEPCLSLQRLHFVLGFIKYHSELVQRPSGAQRRMTCDTRRAAAAGSPSETQAAKRQMFYEKAAGGLGFHSYMLE